MVIPRESRKFRVVSDPSGWKSGSPSLRETKNPTFYRKTRKPGNGDSMVQIFGGFYEAFCGIREDLRLGFDSNKSDHIITKTKTMVQKRKKKGMSGLDAGELF
jgi:hypothetical protein